MPNYLVVLAMFAIAMVTMWFVALSLTYIYIKVKR